MLWTTDTQINKLTIRGAGRDSPALRLAASHQVSNLDITTTAIPPSAVLIIKKLSDPHPRSIRPGKVRLTVNRQWESTINDKLSEFYTQAARPIRGFLPSNTKAVVFNDEAEMLACLTLDLLRGTAGTHWWWQQILKYLPDQQSPSVAVSRVLSESPWTIPAVIENLNTWQQLEKVIGSITRETVLSLTEIMLQEFGLASWLQDLKSRRFNKESTYYKRQSTDSDKEAFISINSPPVKAQPLTGFHTPWVRWLGADALSYQFNPEQCLLIGLAQVLHRTPWLARQVEFKQSITQWWISTTAIQDEVLLTSATPKQDKRNTSPFNIEQPDDKKPVTSDIPEIILESGSNTITEKPIYKTQLIEALQRYETNSPQWEQVEKIEPVYSEKSTTKSNEIDSQFDHELSEDNIPAIESRNEELFVSTGKNFSTQLGGVLYLINLLQQLELANCFESQWGMASRISPWALLEIIARAVLKEELVNYYDDPIWAVLRELDSRDQDELLADGLISCDEYYLPLNWYNWLKTEKETYRWAAARNHLRLWSASGYVLAEIPRSSESPVKQARMILDKIFNGKNEYLLSRSAFDSAPVFSHKIKCGVTASRWLSLAMPAILHYLCIVTGIKNTRTIGSIFTCPGQLIITNTHIDFITVMDRISMPVRSAGFDRDPGWMPDYGRIIKFHFN